MNKLMILVVEDDVPVRNLIVTTLKTHQYQYLTAPNGESAILEASSHNPDVMLLDLGLPDMDGVDVIRRIRTWSNLPIIVISARSEDTDKIEALDAGADDYLTKPFHPLELLARVKSQMKRYTAIMPEEGVAPEKKEEIEIQNLTINKAAHVVKKNGQEIALTPIEFDILYLLASNRDRVFSTDEIFERVWNEKVYEVNNTVMVHIRRLREKIEDNSRSPKILKTVWGVGYKIES